MKLRAITEIPYINHVFIINPLCHPWTMTCFHFSRTALPAVTQGCCSACENRLYQLSFLRRRADHRRGTKILYFILAPVAVVIITVNVEASGDAFRRHFPVPAAALAPPPLPILLLSSSSLLLMLSYSRSEVEWVGAFDFWGVSIFARVMFSKVYTAKDLLV